MTNKGKKLYTVLSLLQKHDKLFLHVISSTVYFHCTQAKYCMKSASSLGSIHQHRKTLNIQLNCQKSHISQYVLCFSV